MRPSELKSIRGLLEAIRNESASIRDAVKESSASIADQNITQQKSAENQREEIRHAIWLALDSLTKQKKQHDDATDTNEERRHRQNLVPQWITAISTSLAFIAAAIYAGIANHELTVTRRAAEQAKIASDTATNQVWQAVGNVNWMARSMDESSKQSQEALASTVNLNEVAQRAWLAITVAQTAPFAADQTWAARVTIHNTGRTPAIHARSTSRLMIVWPNKAGRTIQGIRPPIFKPTDFGSSGDIFPGDDRVTDFPFPVSKEQYDLVMKGRAHIYILGKVEYQDVFGQDHWVTFCRKYLTGGLFQVYEKYNDVDQPSKPEKR